MHSQHAEPVPNNRQLAAEQCNLVRDWLQDSDHDIDQSKEVLTEVTKLLGGDSSPEAGEIWEIAGELWRSLVSMLIDLESARETLLVGVDLFAGKPPTQTFEMMLYQLEQAFNIQRAIQVEPDQGWPAWLEKRDAPQRLTHVVKAFDVLNEAENWPYLQTQIDKYFQAFISEMLPTYLESLNKSARQHAQQREFAMSNLVVETIITLLRHEIRPYFQLSFTEDDLHQLKDALAIREQAEVALWSAAVRLSDPDIPFGDVVSNISVLIMNHPDIPVQDMNTLISDLYQAEKIEALFNQASDLDNFTENILSYQTMEDISFEILNELPEFLVQADIQLASKLQSRFKSLADLYNNSADKTALTLAERIQGEILQNTHIEKPDLISRFYWQAYWCHISGIIKDPSVTVRVKDSLKQVETSLDNLLTQITAIFVNMASDTDMDRTLVLLEALRALNLGLVHNTDQNQRNIHQLPPLPAGIDFPETTTRHKVYILEKWAVINKSWLNLERVTQDLEQEPIDDIDDLESAKNIIFEMLRDFNVLKKDIWPGLSLREWSESKRIGMVGTQLYQLHQLITVLSNLDRNFKNKSAIDLLVYLDEHIKDTGLLEKIEINMYWPLELPSKRFINHVKERYRTLHKKVNQQISTLMRLKTGFVQNFRAEILAKPQSQTTAEFLFEVIISNADWLANMELQAGNSAGANSLWDSISASTKPWKKRSEFGKTAIQLNPPVAEQWRKLYQKSIWKKLRILVTARRQEITISAAVIVMVMITWVVINTISPRNRPVTGESGASLATPLTPDTSSSATHQTTQEDTAGTTTDPQIFNTPISADVMGLNMTATANVLVEFVATRQAVDSIAGTGTAVAVANAATETADHETSLAQAATATAIERITATAEAFQCIDAVNYPFTLSPEMELAPPAGTTYITGTTPIQPAAVWEVTNTGTCAWREILLSPILGDKGGEPAFWRGDQRILNLAEQPVRSNEHLKIGIHFDVVDATDIQGEWVLVVNGYELIESPHLVVDVENWITLITPPSSRP